jgi:hypothetical protein
MIGLAMIVISARAQWHLGLHGLVLEPLALPAGYRVNDKEKP